MTSNIFFRKTLIRMMEDVFPHLRKKERRKIALQLDNLKANKSLEAAWELAVGWALSRDWAVNFHYEADGVDARPDLEIIDMGFEKKILIEIKSPSGNTFQFKEKLDRISQEIFNVADRITQGSGSKIGIVYDEWRRPGHDIAPRIPAVADGVVNSEEFLERLSNFLLSDASEVRIDLPNVINAGFSKRKFSLPFLDYYCRIPTDPQSVKNNLTSAMIAEAKRQLGPFRGSHFVGLVICDGGNNSLSEPNKTPGFGRVTGKDLMGFIVEEADIDFVVFIGRKDVPRRGGIITGRLEVPQISINVMCSEAFHKSHGEEFFFKLAPSLERIPVPQYHPYQAKSLLEQASMRGEERVHMLPNTFSSGKEMKVKISSNGLLRMLSGRASSGEEKYIRELVSDISQIERKSIKSISIEDVNGEHDDSYVVIELGDDLLKEPFSEVERNIKS
jgi:hypothetical protein